MLIYLSRMNRKKLRMFAAVLISGGMGVLLSCTGGAPQKEVSGVLEEPVVCQMPDSLKKVLEKSVKLHQFEIMSDTANNVSVMGIGELDGGVSAEGYGVVVVKNATSTLFPDIRNGRQPRAFYDADARTLWLTSCVMEGTGICVEQLYKIQFGTDNDSARIVATVEPFELQQKLIGALKYSIEGDNISIYANGQLVAVAKNTVTDMGGFDSDDPIWIGEQISYDLKAGNPLLYCVPGVKFTTGLVLTYDDMPTLSANVEIGDDGNFDLKELKVKGNQ